MKHIFLAALLMLFCFPVLAQDVTKASSVVTKAQTYLNNLKTVKADFIQVADWDNSSLSGTFYLKRPGKLRFDYNSPVEDFIVADGTFIFYYDAELQQQSNAPIGSTLAGFILRDPIHFSGDVKVSRVEESETGYFITLVQTEDPHAGALTLVFQKQPFQLKEWVVQDTQGLLTRVALTNMQTGVQLDRELFYYIDPEHGKFKLND